MPLNFCEIFTIVINDLANRYGLSVLQIINDMFRLTYSQSGPFLHDLIIRFLT